MTHSCLYEGRIRHRRFAPVPHDLEYALFMLYADLDEIPALLEVHPAWSARRPALAWLRRADHFGDARQGLAEAVREVVRERTGRAPRGPIRLLTHPRTFGFAFNPVSFFYCFDAHGERVETVVSEVNNTPWGERHLYVLPRSAARVTASKLLFDFDKQFHVSPFMPMQQRYAWRFGVPGESLSVHMESREAGELRFDATLTLKRTEISRASLGRVLRGYPLMTAKVFTAVYWNALQLALKRAPFFDHPANGRPRPKTTVGDVTTLPTPPLDSQGTLP